MSKTGTKTLGRALSILGYRGTSYDKNLLVEWSRDHHENIWRRIDRFDCFNDWPYPLLYKEIMERFGRNAFFVLTVRKDAQTWLESLKRHALRSDPRNAEFRKIAYGVDYPQIDEAAHIERYERHSEAVLQTATRLGLTERLRVMCWERGDGWQELCSFLSVPQPTVPFPHANSAESVPVNRDVVDQNLRIICEIRSSRPKDQRV